MTFYYLERLWGNMPQCLGWCGRPTFDFRGAKLFQNVGDALIAASHYSSIPGAVMDENTTPWGVAEYDRPVKGSDEQEVAAAFAGEVGGSPGQGVALAAQRETEVPATDPGYLHLPARQEIPHPGATPRALPEGVRKKRPVSEPWWVDV